MIDFSVIVAYYYGNKYVDNIVKMLVENKKRLIESGYQKNIELIIVNDSPDDVVNISQNNDDVEINVINHQINQGIHQARITGLEYSKGEYILILDQDDKISDDFLVKHYKNIGNADVSVGNAVVENSDMSCHLLYPNKTKFSYVSKLQTYIKGHNQIMSPGQCLIKKDAIPCEWKEYVIRKNGSDDLFLWILMLAKGCELKVNEHSLYKHSYTGTNLSADMQKMLDSTLEIAEYLDKISYISKKDIKSMVRAHKLKVDISKSNVPVKLFLCLRHIDIAFPCLIWKIRSMGQTYDFYNNSLVV